MFITKWVFYAIFFYQETHEISNACLEVKIRAGFFTHQRYKKMDRFLKNYVTKKLK